MAKKKKKKKARPLDAEFLQWADEYNQWRVEFGWPKMVPTVGLMGSYFQAVRGAEAHDEPFPSWEDMSAGAKAMLGWPDPFTPSSAGWMLGPQRTLDRNILKVARWGKQARSDVQTEYIPSAEDSVL